MWPSNFTDRLAAFSNLRIQSKDLPLEQALADINAWWFSAPWCQYYLHWDDAETWPDPWELLNDDTYCELARGLGILYTISMMEHKDLTSAELVLTEEGYNLVLVNQGIYTLNWENNNIVNNLQIEKIQRQFTLAEVNQRYN